MPVRIVTDSTCDLPRETVESLGITVVPLTVSFGSEPLKDGVDIDASTFYERLTASNELPKTSQPSVEAFADVYRELAPKADGILSIHISSRLSGTLNSASVARESVEVETPIELLDSYQVSLGLGETVLAAARAAREGLSLDQVAAAARSTMDRVSVIITLDTLEYLRKGGRIGRAQSLVGGALRIKPIVHIDGGEVAPLERVRTRAKAAARIEALATADRTIEALHVACTGDDPVAAAFIARVAPMLPHTRVELAHIGPDALGICTVRKRP